MSKGLEQILEHTNDNGKKKQKSIKQISISSEEIAKRKAAAREKALANTLKSKQATKLSAEERNELRRQKEARKVAAYHDRWEASHNARILFCRYASLACLIVSPQRLDPIIGTSSCQQYAMLAVALHTLIRRTVSASEWYHLEETSRRFIGTTAMSDLRANLLPVVNYELPVIAPEMKALLQTCETIFSTAQLRYLQLALLLWETKVLSFDEFGQVCRCRGNASLGKYESELRSEFSCLADSLYADEARRLLQSNKLVEVYQRTTSEYYMDKERAYPVRCPSVFTTFNINNHIAWNSDLIIAIGMTRVGISSDLYLDQATSSSQADYSYQLGFCDIYYYRKGHSTFDLIEEPSEEERSQACIFFDCVGTSFTSNDNHGMYSLDQTEFRQAFKEVDPAWLLMSWAAGHPDHARRAEHPPSLTIVHNEVYGDQNTRHLTHNHSSLQNLNFSLPPQTQATPAELLTHGLSQATTTTQTGNRHFNDFSVARTEAVPRTTNELYFHVVHVYASTGKAEEQRQRAIRERHSAAGPGSTPPRLGRYIFTAGRAGLSCRERGLATALQASTRRLPAYLARYPGREVFCGSATVSGSGNGSGNANTTVSARRMSCAASTECVDRARFQNVAAFVSRV